MAQKTTKSGTKPHNSIFFGLAVRERGPSGRWRIRFRWGLLAGVMLAIGILGYCLLVTGFYFYFKDFLNFKEVRYADMYTLLFNRAEHREKMGNYQIDEAKAAIEKGKFREALQYLRTGLVRAPENLEGRVMLADFFLYGFRPARQADAITILREGVPYAYNDADYLKKYMTVLLANQKDAEIVEVAQKILSTEPSEPVTRILALASATAHYYRGNFDEAESILKRYDLEKGLDGALLSARISWDRGQKDVALSKLKADLEEFKNDEPFYELLTLFYRELGDNAKARQYAVLRNINAPLSVQPRIDLLYIFSSTGQKERALREAEAILEQFSNDERSLLALANYATEEGSVELSRRIYERALENDFNIQPFALLLIESQIVKGNLKDAIDFSNELMKERPAWLESVWPVFNSLRAVAYYGLGNKDLTTLYLNQFLENSDERAESLIAVSNRFQSLGGKNEARRILMQAYKQNPNNQAALSKLIALEIELGNSAELGPYLEQLLQMRRPSTTILSKAYQNLGSDHFIFTRDRKDLLIELESIIRGEPMQAQAEGQEQS